MPRRWLKRVLPDVDKIREHRLARILGPRLFHPALWHLSRRSVAGAVAIGMFCGLIPGPLQMLGAAIGSVMFKRNLPVALVTTFYTNPFTIIPLYLVAYQLGAWLTGTSVADVGLPHMSGSPAEWTHALVDWSMALGQPLAIGLPALAALLAVAGYFFVLLTWGSYLRWTWHRRKRIHAQ